MENKFELIPGLAKKYFVCDLPLCTVLMENKKDFPWVFLVPRRADVVQINHLSMDDQQQLLKEIDFVSNAMEKLFDCDRLNVAAIGNMSPQLHVHIICRTKNDPYFPDVVWNKPMEDMTDKEAKERLKKIKQEIQKYGE